MDIRRAIGEFIAQGRVLLEQLRSAEGPAASPVDLHILRVQLFFQQVANMQRAAEVLERKTQSSP